MFRLNTESAIIDLLLIVKLAVSTATMSWMSEIELPKLSVVSSHEQKAPRANANATVSFDFIYI